MHDAAADASSGACDDALDEPRAEHDQLVAVLRQVLVLHPG